MLGPNTAVASGCTALVLRFLLAPWSSQLLQGAHPHALVSGTAALSRLAGRSDVESALHSLDGVSEGVALRALGLSPYAGTFLHAPPLVQLALGPLVSLPTTVRVLPFIAADALSAACLFRASRLLEQHRQGTFRLNATACALLFLWNPFSVSACIGNNWSSLEICAVLCAVCSALQGRIHQSAFYLALVVHASLHPIALAVPLSLLAAMSTRANAWAAATSFALWMMLFVALLSFVSVTVLRQQGATVQEWLQSTYVFMLRADDLTPNMGLWWYFFAVIFDHFRSFFLFVFHIQPLLLLLPVSLRLSHKPIALLAIASLLVTLFKPYSCLGDLSLCVSLISLACEEMYKMKAIFVAGAALVIAGLLNPVLMRDWVERYVGNANFVLATCIMQALALTTTAVDLTASALAR